VGFSSLGGIAGSLIFRSQDRPYYRPGIYAGIGCNILVAVIVGINIVVFRRENKRADREGKILERDKNFRYTI
jgi:hypothetical protein